MGCGSTWPRRSLVESLPQWFTCSCEKRRHSQGGRRLGPARRLGDQVAGAGSAATAPALSPKQRLASRLADHVSASITGTSMRGPTTVARATVGEKAVIAMAIAISKSRPVELKATATASRYESG